MRSPLVLPVVLAAVACPAPAAAATFAAPVEPATIEPGCGYAGRDCLDGSRYHAGVDYHLPDDADEAVLASADGHVAVAARADEAASHDFGNVVVLEHALPGGGRISTAYAHLREPPAVAAGACGVAEASLELPLSPPAFTAVTT